MDRGAGERVGWVWFRENDVLSTWGEEAARGAGGCDGA